jgi:hypothetical protein
VKVWLPWLLVLVLLAVIWRLAAVAMTLENRTYASEVGYCYEPVDYTKDPPAQLRREKCLAQSTTRASAWWHLWYAMMR